MKSLRTLRLSLIIVGFAALPATAQDGPPPALVEVEEATTTYIAPETQIPGTIVSLNDSRIATEISGRVTWVATEGTLVKKGDVIAEIDDSSFGLAVDRATASLARLDARIKFLNSDLERLKELVAESYSPTSRLEEAESNLAMAIQDRAEAQIALEEAKLNLKRTKVKAPFPGRVVQRLAQIGEFSSPGREVVRLVDTEHVEVSAQAPVALAAVLTDGQAVKLSTAAGEREATLRALVPVGDTASRTMELRVSLAGLDGLVVGTAVEVAVPTDVAAEVIAVPRDALVLRGQGTFVFRLAEDGTAERLQVEPGVASGTLIAVRGGVTGGDRVIVRGGERLRPGQSVEIRERATVSSR